MENLDLIIPVYNRPELLEKCISALDTTTGVPFRLTLIDDASPDPKMKSLLLKLGKRRGINIMHNRENMGFGQTVNKAVRTTGSPYICLLNQDIEPLPGWLEVLMETMKQEPDAGIIGPLLLFHPDSVSGKPGTVQHAGMMFDCQKAPLHRFLGWQPDAPKVMEYRTDLQAVTGAVMLMRRTDFTQAGGFAPIYGRGTFEDVELCVQVRNRMHHKIIYQPGAMLYHHVGASARETGTGFPVQLNWMQFLERVGGAVRFDEWKVG